MLIQGIDPPQYSGCFRLGVCPDSRRAIVVNGVQRHPTAAGVAGIPTASASVGGICLVVASRPPVAVTREVTRVISTL
jgi:hypothetical protein